MEITWRRDNDVESDVRQGHWIYDTTVWRVRALAIFVPKEGKPTIERWTGRVTSFQVLYTLDSVEEAKKLYTMLAALEGV